VCFSPQADVAGGLLICAIGVGAVCHIGRRREFIALAWLPALLGAHQFIEALVARRLSLRAGPVTEADPDQVPQRPR
jgi:hypothetical protein